MFAFSLVIPIFVAMSAGGQIAGERRAGTLRMMCIRPVARVSIVLSKFLVVAIHTYLLMAFFIGLNLLVGLLFVGWGNLELYPGPLNLVDAPGQILRDEALWRFFYASFSGTWALLVVAAIALLLSVLFDNPVTAVAATLALYLMLYIVGRIEFFVEPAAVFLHHRHGFLARRFETGDTVGESLSLRRDLRRLHLRVVADGGADF